MNRSSLSGFPSLICSGVLVAVLLSVGTVQVLAAPWTESVMPSGDLRYRFEYIDEEGADSRYRERIRARIGLTAAVGGDLDLVFRLASGGDDPVSTNQTLDGGFSTKEIWLDLVYIDWHPGCFRGFHLFGGKMRNPFRTPGKTELVWDGDLTLEGLAASFGRDLGKVSILASGGGFWVEERSQDDDSRLLGVQGGIEFELPLGDGEAFSDAVLVVGGSYYQFTEAEHFPTFYDASDEFGNSVVVQGANTIYTQDYEELEPFAELKFKIQGVPVALHGDYVMNLGVDDANDEDYGWLAGASIGTTNKRGDWKLYGDYRELMRDAVIGAYTDSDFGGGGTNSKGFELGFGYQIGKNVTAGATYFVNELGIGSDDQSRHYQRVQVDLQTKF